MELSSYSLFAKRVNGSGWSRNRISRRFLKEVEKDDYRKSELNQILDFLFALAKPTSPREN